MEKLREKPGAKLLSLSLASRPSENLPAFGYLRVKKKEIISNRDFISVRRLASYTSRCRYVCVSCLCMCSCVNSLDLNPSAAHCANKNSAVSISRSSISRDKFGRFARARTVTSAFYPFHFYFTNSTIRTECAPAFQLRTAHISLWHLPIR